MISINPSELIWTVINFFLLLFLLKRFLYTPILRFMDERQARIDGQLREEREAEQSVRDERDRLTDEKARSREEAKRLIGEAESAQEARHAEAMSRARQDADRSRREAEARLSAQRAAEKEALAEATPELAELLAGRLLGEEESATCREG